jgi:hypothetical protein
MIRNSEASEKAAALPADSIERDEGLFQIGLCDDADGPFPSRAFAQAVAEGASPSASVGAAMSGAIIIARLIGHDRAQAGDIVVRSRSPVFALCRALLAAGANPNSKLECFRGSVLALTVKTIGIGAKLTIKENDWVGPKVVPYEPFSRDRVGRHTRQNDDPALAVDSLAEGIIGGAPPCRSA